MERRALVHIGLEKTGTTALQQWFADQHQYLLASGVLMPTSIGFPNHTKLVAACLDNGVVDNLKKYQLCATGCSEGQFRSLVFKQLDREISAAPSGWHTLLITSELITSRLSSATEIRRLYDQIYLYVDHVEFILFLRRQDRLALSRFSSILRSGYADFEPVFLDSSSLSFFRVPDQRPISDRLFFYNFEEIMSRFEGLPGSSLSIYLYGADHPMDVFADRLAISPPPLARRQALLNPGMSAQCQYILAQLNSCYPVQFPSGMRHEPYRRLQRRVEREVGGGPRTVGRMAAAAFLEPYAAINRRLADRDSRLAGLLSFDGGSYPDSVDYSTLPVVLADQLAAYLAMAAGLPTAETWRQRLGHHSRRLTARLKDRLFAGLA